MFSFTVNVENARSDAFVDLLRANNFTNATVQCSVFPQENADDAVPVLPEEDVDMKLFDDGYPEDEMTRMTRRQMAIEEAKRRKAAAKFQNLPDFGVIVERPFQARNTRMRAVQSKTTRQSRQVSNQGEEEAMEEFVIVGPRNSQKQGGLANTSGLRRSARLEVKEEPMSPSVSPIRKRRVTVKTEVISPPESPVKERKRRLTKNSTVGHSDNDSHSNIDGDLEIVDGKMNHKSFKQTMITCRECGNSARRSRPRQMYHVMTYHTEERSLKCPYCDYEGARNHSLKLHMSKRHASHDAPLDIVNDEKRELWDNMMKKCFPEFANDTGFHKERVNTY